MRKLLMFGALAALLWTILRRRRAAQPGSVRGLVFVVTGASGGIGLATVRALRAQGAVVLGGVRREADFPPLLQCGALPVILDVTRHSDLTGLLDLIRKQGKPLGGVVCNAGVNFNQVVEATSCEDFRRVFEVNVIGVVALVQCLLPMLRNDGGRVVVVGSLAGFVARPLNAVFSASKAAVRAVADALRRECLAAVRGGYKRVHVITVEPGRVSTPGLQTSLSDAAHIRDGMSPELAAGPYRLLLEGRDRVQKRAHKAGGVKSASSDDAASVILSALSDTAPSERYWIGGFSGLPGWMLPVLDALLPSALLDSLVLQAVMAE
eukprot:Hpha_TRINITY_DN2967_c0_g1::TRINITY_DN2967_c0_g1_i1::g.19661::m.19661